MTSDLDAAEKGKKDLDPATEINHLGGDILRAESHISTRTTDIMEENEYDTVVKDSSESKVDSAGNDITAGSGSNGISVGHKIDGEYDKSDYNKNDNNRQDNSLVNSNSDMIQNNLEDNGSSPVAPVTTGNEENQTKPGGNTTDFDVVMQDVHTNNDGPPGTTILPEAEVGIAVMSLAAT